MSTEAAIKVTTDEQAKLSPKVDVTTSGDTTNTIDITNENTQDTNADKDERFAFQAPENTYRLPTSIIFKPFGSDKRYSIKPGYEYNKIKSFKLPKQVVSRIRKVGPRKNFNIKQLLSYRDRYQKFPTGWNNKVIPEIFEEGLGTALGQEINEPTKVITNSSSKKLIKKKGDETNPAKATAFNLINQQLDERNKADISERQSKESSQNISPNNTDKTIKKTPNISIPINDDIKTINDSNNTVNKPEIPKPVEVKIKPARVITGALSKNTRGWVPKALRKTGQQIKVDPMVEFTRKVISILNKITLDNFDTLAAQLHVIFDNDVKKTSQLQKLVSLIFEKTVQEHEYGPLYSKLCKELSKKERKFELYVPSKDKQSKIKKEVNFRRILLIVCEKEFDKGSVPAKITDDMSTDEKNNAEIKQKKILLGTMKFIGQLFIDDLLPSKAIEFCLSKLIGNKATPKEEDIECACNLLSTVGYELDKSGAIQIDNYYKKLQGLSKGEHYSVRIKILIKNLLDSKSKNWIDVRKKRQLKTVDEVRQEWKAAHNGKLPTSKGGQGSDKWDTEMLPLLKGSIGVFLDMNDFDNKALISSALKGNDYKRKKRNERYGDVIDEVKINGNNNSTKKANVSKTKTLMLDFSDDEDEEETKDDIIDENENKDDVVKMDKSDVPPGSRFLRDDIDADWASNTNEITFSSESEFYKKYNENYLSPKAKKDMWTLDQFIDWFKGELSDKTIKDKAGLINTILEKCMFSFNDTLSEKTLKVFITFMDAGYIVYDDFYDWGLNLFFDMGSSYDDYQDGMTKLLSELMIERELDMDTLLDWIEEWMEQDKTNLKKDESDLKKARRKHKKDKSNDSLKFDVKRLKKRVNSYEKKQKYYGEFIANMFKYIKENGGYSDYKTDINDVIKNTNLDITPYINGMTVEEWKTTYDVGSINV